MKKMVLAPLLAFAVNAQAGGFYTVNDLRTKPESVQIGYITGVADGLLRKSDNTICFVESMTIGQIVAVANKFMNEHPESFHLTAASHIDMALMKAFPCK
jgi:hypothetical protein